MTAQTQNPQTGKKAYASPKLTHQGAIDECTLGEPDAANDDTGSVHPYSYKVTKPAE